MAAAAALLCVAIAGGWSLGAAAAGQPGAAAGRRQFVLAQRFGRTKQLESEAMREAALARLEAKVSGVIVCERNRHCPRVAAGYSARPCVIAGIRGRDAVGRGVGAARLHADAVCVGAATAG